MTIKELYEWAKENGLENADIEIDCHYDQMPCVSIGDIEIEDDGNTIVI